jgi:hypothetical protein
VAPTSFHPWRTEAVATFTNNHWNDARNMAMMACAALACELKAHGGNGWLEVRRANPDDELKNPFEQYSVVAMALGLGYKKDDCRRLPPLSRKCHNRF